MTTGFAGLARVLLTGAAIATTVGLAACAPAQPPPRPGGATLSSNVIPYDHPQFRTSRPPLLQFGRECQKMPELLQKLGLHSEPPVQTNFEKFRNSGDGCQLTFADAQVTVTASTLPFVDYWVGAIPQNAPGAPTALSSGVSSLQRGVLDQKYYDVQFTTDTDVANGSAMCHLAVDTGTMQPLLVSGDLQTPNQDPVVALTQRVPLANVTSQYCPVVTKFTEALLSVLDPNGGSRAS